MLLREKNRWHFLFSEDQRFSSQLCISDWAVTQRAGVLVQVPVSLLPCSIFETACFCYRHCKVVPASLQLWLSLSASVQSGSCVLWHCSADAEKGEGWQWKSQKKKSPPSVKAWLLSPIISLFAAHMQVSEILRFKSCFCKCCFTHTILWHMNTELRFIVILFLEYLNCCWRDRLYLFQRTDITKQRHSLI